MKTQETPRFDPEDLAAAERVVEALVFASEIPVPDELLQSRIDVPLELVLERLIEFYSPPRAPRLVRDVGGWRFSCEEAIEELPLRQPDPRSLPKMALGILSVILWHQPVTLAAVEAHMRVRPRPKAIKLLVEQGWIKKGERSQERGRPYTWVTTAELLAKIGFQKLSDVPDPDLLDSISGGREEPEAPFSPAAMPVAGRR